MSQKGCITLSLTGYIVLGCAAVVAVVSGYAYIQTKRLEACKSEFQVFKSEVERLGNEAKLNAELINKQNLKLKEKSDEELRKLRISNADLSKRLRDNAGSSFLSRPEASTGQLEGTCNADLIDRALRDFAKGTAELIIEGQSAIDSLNNAKRWSQSQ